MSVFLLFFDICLWIFELTPSLVVVEVKKKGGDKAEYEKFCNSELRPALENLGMEESASSSSSCHQSTHTQSEFQQHRTLSDSALNRHSDNECLFERELGLADETSISQHGESKFECQQENMAMFTI